MSDEPADKPLMPKAARPGRRWGAGLASIIALLGTRHRTIEDDSTWFAELKARCDEKDDSKKETGKP